MFGSSRQTADNLWTLIAPPTIWAFHFVICYVVAAVRCAPNTGPFEAILATRWFILAFTLVCLLAIALIFRRSVVEWRGHGSGTVNDEDNPTARERFLEFSTILLAGLSFLAVVFTALPAAFITDCR
ncbi:hypothetical protein DYI37_15120 [Fulvimarina endophytica]|uniref:Uncharacterized protein n=1 Tax=Fulvimarina endophytica TaxID=2293836 RepID=A0A371X017_9HYPH|nr:hypothetical protein [Fulvimarina endophytica]RFC62580.1 hypothetical protein DYI37_15120 [Fulvimarina endophytica]